ncbi:hypothetical protein GGI22_003146 [Coemansia erecta]|nr:hypothetical protein GGI22_003146 [Coemansia erecta]
MANEAAADQVPKLGEASASCFSSIGDSVPIYACIEYGVSESRSGCRGKGVADKSNNARRRHGFSILGFQRTKQCGSRGRYMCSSFKQFAVFGRMAGMVSQSPGHTDQLHGSAPRIKLRLNHHGYITRWISYPSACLHRVGVVVQSDNAHIVGRIDVAYGVPEQTQLAGVGGGGVQKEGEGGGSMREAILVEHALGLRKHQTLICRIKRGPYEVDMLGPRKRLCG